ncbi:MAG: hypothetical protein RIE56_00710, partial [Amphiplicatus sp.]
GVSGSGQLMVQDIAREFNLPQVPAHPDIALLHRLAKLPSYDVYSLLILLRDYGIPVNDMKALKLSAQKTRELTSYMTAFTRPLMKEIYAGRDVAVENFEDVVALFRNPDVKDAKEKLVVIADKLGIELADIPRFLEDYGDIFLSFSYYRHCLDNIMPSIETFIDSLQDLRCNHQLRQDAGIMRTCTDIEAKVNELTAAITGRFENFERSTVGMWDNISADRFRQVEKLIKSYHTTIGGVLCSLSVKIDAWKQAFPKPYESGPLKRAEFIMSDMKTGFDVIQRIEDSAPMLSAVA